MSLQVAFSNRELKPVFGVAREFAASWLANLQLNEGTIVAQITGASANATQTITIGGTPTGGTFVLDFNGKRTGAITWSASGATLATNIRTALAALTNINGTANVNVTGTGPWTVTFQGELASQPQPLLVVVANNMTGVGPTITIAAGTTGQKQGSFLAYDGTVLSPPSAPTVASLTGGTHFPLLSSHFVQVTYVTLGGETLPSIGSPVALTTTDRSIRVSQISSVPSQVTHARFYVNGVRYAETAVSGGNIAQTDISAAPGAMNLVPQSNTGYTNGDGRAIAVGVLKYPLRTDERGRVTYGDQIGNESSVTWLTSMPIFCGGVFRRGDLTGIDAAALVQLNGRILRGSSLSDNEALLQLAA